VYEILDSLPRQAVVLDLGAGPGSFDHSEYRFLTVRADLERADLPRDGRSVVLDAVSLPFAGNTFDAVILSHVLEHVAEPKRALQEIGRVLKPSGAAYVAVPDGRLFSDRLYRKVFRDRGGHISLFDSAKRLQEMIAWYLGLPHVQTRELISSFAYLNRKNFHSAVKRRQLRVPPLPEWAVLAISSGTALFDRLAGTSLSYYGWAMYFGHIPTPISSDPEPNVCIRCGKGLDPGDKPAKAFYRCSHCKALNACRTLAKRDIPVL